jgi:hypothetical protein
LQTRSRPAFAPIRSLTHRKPKFGNINCYNRWGPHKSAIYRPESMGRPSKQSGLIALDIRGYLSGCIQKGLAAWSAFKSSEPVITGSMDGGFWLRMMPNREFSSLLCKVMDGAIFPLLLVDAIAQIASSIS